MSKKKFTVAFKGGDLQIVYAATSNQDEGEGGCVFFLDENGEIVAVFDKSVVAEWREEESP